MGNFQQTASPSPKLIIHRNGTADLTLGIDRSSSVAYLRTLLTERLPDLSDNEQFMHSNGAPIHVMDEDDTIVSELLVDDSDVISIQTNTKTKPMAVPTSTHTSGTTGSNKESQMQPIAAQNQSQTQAMVSPSAKSPHTIMLETESGRKSVLLSDLLSNAKLEIDNEKLPPRDMKRIVAALKQNKYVRELKVTGGCTHIIDVLADVLKTNQTLTRLDISGDVNDDVCFLLSHALIHNYSVRELHLRENKITFLGCQAIGEMLKSNTTLKSLDICRNRLGDRGIEFICDALLESRTLQRLDIYQTNISLDGCRLVAQMLRTNRSLTWLDIGGNYLGDSGITIVADALKDNRTLVELATKWNKINENGALALVDTLKTNQTLRKVKLQFNDMPQDVQVRINQQTPALQTTGYDICFIF